MSSKVLLIYTGGTIGMNRNPQTGALEPFDFEHLLVHVPELEQFDTEIETYQFTPAIDSSDMTPARWTDISHCIADRYDDYDGFVVLHGTDTMAYTASALSYMLENLTKPVIFTGSQLPIGQLRTDGKENLITAVEIAAAKDAEGHALVPEVGIYFGGHLLRGNRTTKQSAEEFNAFESFNYPHLVDAGVNITYHQNRILTPDRTKSMTPHFRLDNNVIIFSLFPGIREDLIRHIIHTPNLKAIVMRTFGSGNAPQSPWLLKALKEGTRNGKVIVNISQCMQGCRHQTDVPPEPLPRRSRHHPPPHGPKPPRRNHQIKRIILDHLAEDYLILMFHVHSPIQDVTPNAVRMAEPIDTIICTTNFVVSFLVNNKLCSFLLSHNSSIFQFFNFSILQSLSRYEPPLSSLSPPPPEPLSVPEPEVGSSSPPSASDWMMSQADSGVRSV